MTVTQSELTNILSVINNRCEVTIVTKTEPEMRKTNNPFVGKVSKISIVHGLINWSYSDEVNKQRQRESGFAIVDGVPQMSKVEVFTAHPRKWGVRLENSPFVEHKGTMYIEVKVNSTESPTYIDENGAPIVGDKLEELKSFFPKKSESGRQDVENPVILRDYRIDRILALTLLEKNITLQVA